MRNFIAEFVKSATRFSHYPDGTYPDVAFAGRSNVGKSSLINTLLGRKRLARTSGTPGRTQQINFFLVGKEFYFVDLPGYGFARVPLAVKKEWGPMVEEYLRGRKNLRMVIVILDIRREPSTEDLNLIDWLAHYGIPRIFVLTKTDKLSKSAAMIRRKEIGDILQVAPEKLYFFSAKTGQGREELRKAVFGEMGD
ncbi:MAG: ribosome biogenesis GTP-binding protein YihA/YsxC [Syntrophales bacterium]|nr:ribosome biogenesis GTP-binding protein YihA/YsxC [Syntrophales bacterium]